MSNEYNIVGKYRHYKGNEYEVLGEGIQTETGEKFVVYRALNDPSAIWVRPYDMFFETITIDAESIPRFQKIES